MILQPPNLTILLPPPLPQLCEHKVPDSPRDGRPHTGFGGNDLFGGVHEENEFVGLTSVLSGEFAPERMVGVM